MKQLKRAVSLVLTLMLALSLAPAGFVDALPGLSARAAGDTMTIQSVNDWNTFVRDGKDYAGGTVTLAADIELSGDIFIKDTFRGAFNGNGHTIRIAHGSQLVSPSDTNGTSIVNVGLFGTLDGATVENLNIQLDGTLDGSKVRNLVLADGDNTYRYAMYFGVLAGAAKNSSTIRRVALTNGSAGGLSSTSSGTFRVALNYFLTNDANIGGLVGTMNNSTLEECFTGADILTYRWTPNRKQAVLRSGALVGFASNCTIRNCYNANASVTAYHSNPEQEDHTAAQAGGIAATLSNGSTVANCVVEVSVMSVMDLTDTRLTTDSTVDGYLPINSYSSGRAGYIYALKDSDCTVSQCYAYNGARIGRAGYTVVDNVTTGTAAESSAKQALLSNGTVWVESTSAKLGLAWMFQTPSVTLTPTEDGADVTIEVSQQDPVTPRPAATSWSYTVQGALMGRKATPSAPEIQAQVPSQVSSVKILESRAGDLSGEPTSYEHYSGGTYQLYAEVTGTNLDPDTAVTWSLEGVTEEAATVDQNGLLTIQQPYFGTFTVKAEAGGKSASCPITVRPAQLSISPAATEAAKGGSVDFGAVMTGYFGTGGSKYKVLWSVEGGQAGTSIDENGTLTVAAGETASTLTVSATFEASGASEDEQKLIPVATATVTVKDAPDPVEKTVTPSASGQNLGTATLALGQKLKLNLASITVTPPQGYAEEDGKPPVTEYTLTPADTGVLSGSQGSYTAAKAGTVTIETAVSRTFEKEGAAGGEPQSTTVRWTSELKVTVSPVAAVENRTAAMAEVKGTKNTPELKNSTTQEYTLTFAASESDVRWYQLTTTSTPPTSSGWVSIPAEGLTCELTKEQKNAFNGNGLYLWMYREGDKETTEDSPVVGYLLKAGADGAAQCTELDSAPARAELPYKAQFSVSGTWTVENGQVAGSPFSAVELLRGVETEYTTLAACELRVSVRQTEGSSGLYASRGTSFISEAVQSVAVGNTALKPTIQPNAEGQLSNNKFTITVPDQPDVEVYYQIYPNRSAGQISSAEYPDKENGILYDPASQKEIAYPTGVYEQVTVIAITYPKSGSAMKASEPEIVTYTPENLVAPEAPQLVIGESEAEFVGGDLYDDGEIFKFRYTANTAGGEPHRVYYTVNGRQPDASSGLLYDPENPPAMDFGIDSKIEINAIVYDPNYGLSSSVATFTVNLRSSAEPPVASAESGSTVRPSQSLTLELDENFVERLPNVSNFLSAQYAEYSAESEVFRQYADYTMAANSDEPIEGVRYLIVDSGSTFSSAELPTIRYLKNDSETSLDNASVYQYAVCQIWNEVAQEENEETGEIQEVITRYIRYKNPSELLLDGAPGDKITIRAKLYPPTGVTSYLASSETSFSYTVRGSVAAPQAVPATDMQGGTAVDIGSRIALTSDANSEIFYTVNGTQPAVQWNQDHWEPANESTLKYDSAAGIRVPNEDAPLFVLYAIAVSANDTLEQSSLASFVYTVTPLPQAAAPTASPATDSANPTRLANGERITLTTTTLNTDIYYTTDGSVPSYADRDTWDAGYAAAQEKGEENGVRWYTDGEGRRQTEPATRIYDVQQGITMAASEAQPFFTVTAIALDKDRNAPASSVSDAVSFVYRLAQTEAPAASPATSAEAVTTLEPDTTITLTCGTAGAKIYYTRDTTLPDVSDTARVEQEYAAWLAGWNSAEEKGTDEKGVRWYTDENGDTRTEPSTIPYDAARGISMPDTVTTFFTLRAVAVVTDGSRAASDPVTFSYQLPAPVQAVYASPVDGTAVEHGTAVTLQCGTEGAQIFYKIYTSQPGPNDAPVVNQDLSYTEPISITKEVWIQAVAVRQGVKSVVSTYHYTVAPTAAAPGISLPSGSVVPKGTRVALSGEGTIVFTTDGSDPKAADAARQYGTAVNLDGEYGSTITVRAYIQRDGYTPSDTVSFSYTICPEEDYLNISTESGSVVANGTGLTLSTGVTNGQIFYTLDGSTPQVKNVYTAGDKNYTTYEWAAASDATKAGSTVTLSGNPDTAVTVRAIAVVNGGEGGQVATFTYKFQPRTAAPTASIPTGAVVFDGAAVTLTAKEGTIYYTTDGTDPTTSSRVYTDPIDVSGSSSTVLKAIAVVDGKAASEVATFRYTRAGQVADPVFSVASGEIDTGTQVAITSATEDAVIYYSTDGTEPTAGNLKDLTMYVAPVTITRAVTIKAIAVSDKLDPSGVQSATYTVKKPAEKEPEEPASSAPQTTVTDRLTSRRTYNSAQDGPTYSDTVLRESACNTVLSAPDGVVPQGAVLNVQQVDPSQSDEASVKSSLGQDIARVYEAQLTLNGESVTPAGKVELGFAIPTQYQNGVVSVSRINDDGTLTQFTARRSGGVAYIETDALGRFALSVPAEAQAADTVSTALLWGGALAVILAALLIFLLRRRRKQAEDGETDIQSLEEFQNFDGPSNT